MSTLSNDKKQIADYLQSISFLEAGEQVKSTESPGAGNMNFTLRVITSSRSFIVKQSRDYVEKYPQVAAPAERVLMEAKFYESIAAHPDLSSATPGVLYVDKLSNILIIEDLGSSSDFTYLYEKDRKITLGSLKPIIDFLTTLHTSVTTETSQDLISNREMRELNHQHIFIYPYAEANGLNLDDVLPGLQAEAMKYIQDDDLKSKVLEVGKHYLVDGDTLLHGDYFPGSWLETSKGIYIIDPEFCFFGPPEFELGVMLAHLMMAGQNEAIIKYTREQYMSQIILDEELLDKFIGVELIRRMIGLAQLPLTLNLNERRKLLLFARKMIICQ